MGPSDMPDPLGRFGIGIALSAFFIGLVVQTVLVGIFVAITGSNANSIGASLVGLPGFWVGLAGVPVLASKRWGSGNLRRDLAFDLEWPRDVYVGIGAGLVTSMGVGVVLVIFRALSPGLQVDETSVEVVKRASGLALAALIVLVTFGAPVVEELFFRGLFQRSLQRRLPAVAAVAIAGVVFGLVHYSGHGVGVVALVTGLSLFGWVVGALVVHFRRLGPAIVAHMTFNALSSVQIIADSVRHH